MVIDRTPLSHVAIPSRLGRYPSTPRPFSQSHYSHNSRETPGNVPGVSPHYVPHISTNPDAEDVNKVKEKEKDRRSTPNSFAYEGYHDHTFAHHTNTTPDYAQQIEAASRAQSQYRVDGQATAPRYGRNAYAKPTSTQQNAVPEIHATLLLDACQAEAAVGETRGNSQVTGKLAAPATLSHFPPFFPGFQAHSSSSPTSPTQHRARHPTAGYLIKLAVSSSPQQFYPPISADPAYQAAMSLSYESQSYMPDATYPNMMQNHHEQDLSQLNQQPRYPSPSANGLPEGPYHPQNLESPTTELEIEQHLPSLPLDDEDSMSPGRTKAIVKPDREVTKADNGRFICTWVGCGEETKDFGRKCEWSKHMDKHDRPYKCAVDGCEKLPGFTYSGGLLRHEREVHGKHGGPRKQLNCPHQTCKRNAGKGFSRQENLNEHLRRVHTDNSQPLQQQQQQQIMQSLPHLQDAEATEEEHEDLRISQKRKRVPTVDEPDIREEVKRVRSENEELRRHSEAQSAQITEMMRQIHELQQAQLAVNLQQHARMPQASMLG